MREGRYPDLAASYPRVGIAGRSIPTRSSIQPAQMN